MSEEQKALPPGPQPKAAADIEFGEVGVRLNTAEDAWRFAKRAFDSNLLPEQIQNANQAFVILCKGAELGLPPFAAWNFVYLTKARRLTLMTKGALAVVQSKPSFDGYREWIEGEGEDMKAVAAAKRKGFDTIIKEFSYQDANVAGLLRIRKNRDGQAYDSTYQAYLKDMLLSRARGRALDLAFAAELGGIALEGIAEDADMMDARANGRGERFSASRDVRDTAPGAPPRAALGPGAPRDPLFEMLGTTGGFSSGPAPAVQPATTPPAEQPIVRDTSVETTTHAGPEAGGASPALVVGGCPRCRHVTNVMGGCDVCGWPGGDLR